MVLGGPTCAHGPWGALRQEQKGLERTTRVAAIAQGWILQKPRGWAGWGGTGVVTPFPHPPQTVFGWGTHPDQGLRRGWVMLGVGWGRGAGMDAGGVPGGSQHPAMRWGGEDGGASPPSAKG